MTELIRNWLLGITCAAMVLALAESLAPEGSVKRVCRLAGGLVLLLAAIGPVVKLDEGKLARLTRDYHVEAEEYGEELTRQQEILYESIIAEECAAYILDKAEKLGISCRAEVTVAWQDGVPQPHTAIIAGTWTAQQHEALCGIIESELGIDRALQYYEEKEP